MRIKRSHLVWIGIGALLLCFENASVASDVIPRSELDPKTFCGISRSGCDPQHARDLGMIPTGTRAVFPDRLSCPQVDSETWALDYSEKRAREAIHGGIDIPSPTGTPILAVANGDVVGLFESVESPEGIKVYLRHSPEQSGKSYWSYSEYAHLVELPKNLKIGDSVKRGNEVGKTSNTGISGWEARERNSGMSSNWGRSKVRRPALHFSIMTSDNPKYHVTERHIVPLNGRWLDPIAFFRTDELTDPKALIGLSQKDKATKVPVIDGANRTIPDGSKTSWPYRCKPS